MIVGRGLDLKVDLRSLDPWVCGTALVAGVNRRSRPDECSDEAMADSVGIPFFGLSMRQENSGLRKALDGLTASEIKKAAGPMCKTLPRESLSPIRIKPVFGQDKKPFDTTPRDKS
ncbi:hypothetical protein VNO77_46276 [Canavalia gladiata]|uniref:Uncharacterized protein n=1 Tax=Canavalia gladiata TaxID=3824 RepID=A0AAN9JFY9_CANGL